MRRLAHWLLVLALSFSIGLQWAVMQSAAWVGMVISYSQEGTLSEALTKTFDGEHPCALCKAVQSSESSPKKQNSPHRVIKFELAITEQQLFFFPPRMMTAMTPIVSMEEGFTAGPPIPPPRMA